MDENKAPQDTEELKVTVEDETEAPAAEAPKPVETKLSDEPDDNELAQYSESVQKRIKQLSRMRHEARRAKESAEKDKEEALRLAQAMWNENQQMRERLTKGETALAGSVNSAATAELDAAKRALKEAMESYDAEKIVDAQEKLNRAVLRAEQAKSFQARAQRAPQQAQRQAPPPQQAPQQQQTPTADPQAVAWQEENAWFGAPEHEEETAFAVGLHNRLTRERGAAYASTQEYYERINARMRETFPALFGEQGTKPNGSQRPATVVAPATRSVPPKSITLTKRQADIARRLNVPLDLYAKQLAALENGNG
jgi:hypothetical protein